MEFIKLKYKKILLVILVAIIIPLIAGGAYYVYEYITSRSTDPMAAIPDDASIIFTTQQPVATWKKLNEESEVWQTFSLSGGLTKLNDALRSIDSALNLNPEYLRMLGNTNIVLSIHTRPEKGNSFLFVQKLPLPFSETMLHRFLNRYGSEVANESFRYRSCKVRANVFGVKNTKVWHTVYKGLFIAAFEPESIRVSIDQIKDKPAINTQKDFLLVNSTSGKSVPGNVFVQFKNMPSVLSVFSAKDFSAGFGKLGNFARWAGLDLIIQSDKLIFSGFTHAQGTDFLKLFGNQKPTLPQALSVLPKTTASFACLSFDNYLNFIDGYNNYLADIQKIDNSGEPTSGIDVSVIENLKQAGISEITVALINSGYKTALENTLVIVRSKNQTLFKQMLAETLASNRQSNSMTINNRTFGYVDFGKFFGNFLYNILPGFKETYYFTVGDDFIFCPSAQNLYRIIGSYVTGETLINDQGFSSMMMGLNEKSNILLYYHPERSAAFHHFLFEDAIAGNLDSQLPSLIAMDGLAIQFSTQNGRFYSTILLKKAMTRSANSTATALAGLIPEDSLSNNIDSSDIISETAMMLPADTNPDTRALWEFRAANYVRSQPVIVGKGNQKQIVFCDTQHQIYSVNASGTLLWKIDSQGEILGLIQEADILGTGQNAIVFNTVDKLWAVDFNGRVLKNFPINLPEYATNSVSVIRSVKSRKTAVYYVSKSNVLYSLDKNGRVNKDWLKPKATSTVTNPLLYFNTQEGEVILVPMISGEMMICTMDGEVKVESSGSFINSNNSEIYLNTTNSKGLMLTTDEKGNLTYITASGPVEKTVFDNFSNKHFFLYDDFDNNGGKDFIYVDDKELVIYDRFKTVMLRHRFPGSIKTKPLVLDVGNRKYLAVLDFTAGGISLIDINGLVNAEPYRATIPFTAGSLNNKKELFMITASGDRVYCYPIR